jgi:hypothetical protein
MIELTNNRLEFSFPDVHPTARIRIEFQRTLRIPDDGRDYPLPPGLGCFPLRHVDDFAARLPPAWLEHGGVMLPMYQAEAMWLAFHGEWLEERATSYPFAIRVATGKIDATTGEEYRPGLRRDPQNYLVHPGQPWLDGYAVQRGIIRQFVAMPLGQGYTVEEQLTGRAEHGGLQLQVFPMKRKAFEERFPVRPRAKARAGRHPAAAMLKTLSAPAAAMGLAPGGRMRQEVYADRFGLAEWDQEQSSRCFVHLANSEAWRAITGEEPPTAPPTAEAYSRAGLPWFDYYDERLEPLRGSEVLGKLKSVVTLAGEKGDAVPANQPAVPARIIELRRGLRRGQVREGAF